MFVLNTVCTTASLREFWSAPVVEVEVSGRALPADRRLLYLVGGVCGDSFLLFLKPSPLNVGGFFVARICDMTRHLEGCSFGSPCRLAKETAHTRWAVGVTRGRSARTYAVWSLPN